MVSQVASKVMHFHENNKNNNLGLIITYTKNVPRKSNSVHKKTNFIPLHSSLFIANWSMINPNESKPVYIKQNLVCTFLKLQKFLLVSLSIVIQWGVPKPIFKSQQKKLSGYLNGYSYACCAKTVMCQYQGSTVYCSINSINRNLRGDLYTRVGWFSTFFSQ
jgi:hypothetical protein